MCDAPIESIALVSSCDLLLPTEAERTRIRQLTKKLKPSIIKPPDVDVPLPLTPTNNEFAIWLLSLNSTADKNWRDRVVAAWAVGVSDIPDKKRTQAIVILRELLWNRRHLKHVLYRERAITAFKRTFSIMLSLFIGSAIFYVVFRDPKSLFDWRFYTQMVDVMGMMALMSAVVSVYFLPATIPIVVIYSNSRNNESRAMAAKSLLRQNALEAMPEILEGAFDKSEAVRYECRTALRHFLPQITEENCHVMPLNSEEQIGKLLNASSEAALWEAIIDYLEKFGEGSSARAVDNCLELLNVNLPDPVKYSELIAKCERVRVILHQRRTQNNARQELLRHSSVPTTQADQLLRPAADAQATPAEQLLRASNSTDFHS